MAHWIKIETHTPEKAEIRQLARLCNCTKAEAFMAFFKVFCWLDEQTADGYVDFCQPADIDDVAQMKGFGDALQDVRWVTFSQSGATVANWDRHNGESAKKRCLSAERARRHREKHTL